MIYVVYYLFISFVLGQKPLLLKEKNSDQLKLPKWVEVSRKRFNEILSIITKSKNAGLKTNVGEREITLDNAQSLLKGIASRKINKSQFQKEYNNIVDDVDAILQKSILAKCQEKKVDILHC